MEFAKLINASGDSLKDLYEVTGIELDTLVSEARKIDGCIAARMTGAGFGGCTVSVVKAAHAQEFIDTLAPIYESKVGYPASFYITEIGDGGMELK